VTKDRFTPPDQSGRTFVVTGANAGIGYFIAEQLAATGARVVLACRDEERADAARAAIVAQVPEADLGFVQLDLADLSSVRAAAARLLAQERVDVLVNNAGVTNVFDRRLSADGFELLFASNHLGPYALTRLLLPALGARPGSRVVTMSSVTHRWGVINFDDLDSVRRFKAGTAYAQSKLGNLLMSMELDRRLRAAGAPTISVAAHPGFAVESRTPARPPLPARTDRAGRLGPFAAIMTQGKDAGAWPMVRAATDPEAEGGDYFGPAGFQGLKGRPVLEAPAGRALDTEVAARLWTVSEQLTGVPAELR
jgi:NAD(P)-dependent dehydrogenase (short-subunit alcohol dehydrogenase family)